MYVQKYFYQQPTAEILQFVKACQEIREQEIVDVCGIEEKPKGMLSVQFMGNSCNRRNRES